MLLLSLLATLTFPADSLPPALVGAFVDDYGNTYTVSQAEWRQGSAVYHLIKYDARGRYLVAHNAPENRSDPDKYSRIDLVMLDGGTEGWTWGFCLSAWKAATPEEAEAAAPADPRTPRTGCHGFPFSRMKRARSP